MVTASYILAVASKVGMPGKWWEQSFELCETAAVRALEDLSIECSENKSLFTTGDPFTDGTFRPMRLVVIAGALSALSLHHRILRRTWDGESFLQGFLLQNPPTNGVWGESAAPYVMGAALELEQHGHHSISERMIAQFLHTILLANETKGRGIPNPYYEPEDAYRLLSGMDPYNSEVFFGSSYTAEALIEYLARRLCKGTLKYFWERITRIQFVSFQPGADWEWFRWRAAGGTLSDKIPNMPQSWRLLLETAEKGEAEVPELLKKRPSFVPLFSIAFPQRFGVGLLRLLERSLRESR